MTNRTELLNQLRREYESARLAVASYYAKDIKTALSAGFSGDELQKRLTEKLSGTKYNSITERYDLDPEGTARMTVAQAQSFAARYTPTAALDEDGAGAIIFRDQETNKNVVGVRGTQEIGKKPRCQF